MGTVIAYLTKPGDEPSARPASPSAVPEPQPAAPPEKATAGLVVEEPPVLASEPVSKEVEVRVSPRARRLARQLGVDLSKVVGSGRSGRIVEHDVPGFQGVAVPPAPMASMSGQDLRRRQLIAEKLTQSIQTIPHFSVAAEVNAKELIALRENLKGPVQQKSNLKLTMTDLLLKALGLALEETPGMKAVWEGGVLRAYSGCDLGLAIATDKGVVAPVIRGVDRIGSGRGWPDGATKRPKRRVPGGSPLTTWKAELGR